MLLQQRPTRRVLSCATAKLLRDEAESMVPNIDPEQVRKLAGSWQEALNATSSRRTRRMAISRNVRPFLGLF